MAIAPTPTHYSGSPGRPSWSADGKKVAVVLNREALIVNPEDETILSHIGGDARDVGNPQFSPTEDRIAYDIYGQLPGSDKGQWMIQVSRPDGSEPQTIVPHGRRPQWSPDGSKLAFSSYTDDFQTKVSMVNADGTESKEVSQRPESFGFSWSPDGKQIAYEAVGADHYEMHTINLENGEDRFLTDGDGGQYTDRSPAWAPSGRTIAFERRHKRYPAASLWTVDVESGQPKQLFQKLADVVDPVFSPDGKTLVFGSNHDRRGGLDLMSMDVATLKITPLTDLKGDEHSPSFSPDGTTIAYLNTDQRRPSEDRTELHFLKLL